MTNSDPHFQAIKDGQTPMIELGIHLGTPIPPPIPLLCQSSGGRELLRVTSDDEVVIAPDLTMDEARGMLTHLARECVKGIPL